MTPLSQSQKEIDVVTGFYAAIIGFMLIYLSVRTVCARRQYGFGIGDGNNLTMKRIVRAQANFTEYAPIFLILLGYGEINGLHSALVNVLGFVFIVGRAMHAYSLLRYEKFAENGKLNMYPKWRVRGMICTLSSIGLLSTAIMYQLVRHIID